MTKAPKNLMLAGAALASLAAVSPAWAAQSIEGRWLTEEKDAIVTISKCGNSICGRVSKFLVAPPNGVNQRDINNPKASLRKRKLLGLPILTGFVDDGSKWKGKVYDPKSGKTYKSKVTRLSATKLKMQGCVAFFCQGQIWTKAK